VAWSPDGNTLVSVGNDKMMKIKLWEADTGKEKAKLRCRREDEVTGIAFRPDGKQLASAWGNSITLWDVATGKEQISFDGRGGGLIPSVQGVQFSFNGKQLAAVGTGGPITLWETPPPK